MTSKLTLRGPENFTLLVHAQLAFQKCIVKKKKEKNAKLAVSFGLQTSVEGWILMKQQKVKIHVHS